MTQAAEVTHGFSHVLVESQSMGLLLKYVIGSYPTIKIDFGESIQLRENGCVEELFFSSLGDRKGAKKAD